LEWFSHFFRYQTTFLRLPFSLFNKEHPLFANRQGFPIGWEDWGSMKFPRGWKFDGALVAFLPITHRACIYMA
jgi:hypothetical protein